MLPRAISWVACWLLAFGIPVALAGVNDDIDSARDLIGQGEFEAAVALLAPAVATGNPDALLLQGMLGHCGAGVPKDTTRASRLWMRAALAGQAEAARLYRGTLNDRFAREWWQRRIATMPAPRITVPENFLTERQGRVFVNDEAALKWIQRASAKGNAIGLYNAYQAAKFRALMQPAAKEKVRRLLERAAEAGLPEALMELSSEYEQSIPGMESLSLGFPKDRDKAAALMRQAAETGNADAQLLWAHWLGSEKRQFRDKVAAVKYYRLSFYQGNSYAAYFLGEAYAEGAGVPEDKAQADHFFKIAAERGNDTAAHFYGAKLFRGKGVRADPATAIHLLETTAVTSLLVDTDSLDLIAYAYAYGQGVERSTETAVWWCDWAITKQSTYAAELRKKLTESQRE